MLSRDRLKKKIVPIARKFNAAGNVHRLSILYMLMREPMTFSVIVRRLAISPPLALHHLHLLEKSGWVTRSKFGKLVTYYLDDHAAKEIAAFLRK